MRWKSERAWFPPAERIPPPGCSNGRGIRLLFLAAICLGLSSNFVFASAQAAEPPKAFAFVGTQYIMTAESTGPHAFILNFVNLSDYVIVVQPSEFIYKGSSGRFYIGQVFDEETRGTRGDVYRYSASILLNSRAFKGLDVLGLFLEQDRIEELSIRIGSKRFYLQQLDKVRFDEIVAQVEDLNLKSPDPAMALREVGLETMGDVKSTDGTSEWDRDWQGLLIADGINPPRIIESPEVTPTEEARRSNTYGVVKLSARITRDGTIQDITVIKGLGRGLDERAVEAVKLSWMFLPATRNGEVVESTIKFDVRFDPPKHP
jgi:TonB family protein